MREIPFSNYTLPNTIKPLNISIDTRAKAKDIFFTTFVIALGMVKMGEAFEFQGKTYHPELPGDLTALKFLHSQYSEALIRIIKNLNTEAETEKELGRLL